MRGKGSVMVEQDQLRLFRNKMLIIVGLIILGYLFYLSKGVISKLGISIVFMVILDPLVKIIQRYMPRKNRLLAILATFALLGLILLVVLARLVPIVISQFDQAINSLNAAAEQAQKSGQSLSQALAANSPTSSVNALLPYIAKAVPGLITFVAASISSVLGTLFSQLMVFGFVIFGLLEGPQLIPAVKKLLPVKYKNDVVWYSKTLYSSVTSYITGNIFISLCAGAAGAIFCWVAGIPYIGMMFLAVAICDLIPMFGSYLSGLVLGLFALIFQGWDAAVAAVIFVIIYQQFENQILSPIVYHKANRLSPFTVLVVVSIGGAIGGLLGALIAIPVGSTIQLGVLRHIDLRKHSARKQKLSTAKA